MSRELETLLSGTTPLEHALGWLQAAAASPSDHAIRQLHSALPRLCTRLFGKASSNERGLVATPGPATDRLVAAIAAPTGPLMTLLLRADPLLRYHVESEALPLPTQKLLAQGADASALLPSLYFDRVAVTALPASNAAQLNPTANASVTNSKQTDPAFQSRVMLNMLEFFFFSFAHVAVSVTPVLDTRPRPPQQPAFFHGHATPISRPTTPLSQYLQPPQLQSQSQQQSSNLPTSVPSLSLPSLSQPLLRFLNLDDSYYALLKAYLDFFVPLEAPLPVEDPLAQSADLLDASGLRKRFGERAGQFVASATGKPSSGTTSSGPVSVLNSSDLNNVDWNGRVAISKFIVSIFVELWLSQNDYTDAARNGGKYSKSNAIQLQCIQVLVQHVSNLDLKTVFAHQLTHNIQGYHRIHGQIQQQQPQTAASRAQTEIALKAFDVVQKPLYYFLRLAFKFSETDDLFPLVVDIWVTYITPWKKEADKKSVGSGKAGPVPTLNVSSFDVTQEWVPFITQNFLFYSRLLRNYMERAVTFDLFAATRPADLTNPTGGASSASSLTTASGTSIPRPITSAIQQASAVHQQYQQQQMQATKPVPKPKALHASLERVLNVYKKTNGLLDVLQCLDAILVGCELPPSILLTTESPGARRPTSPMRTGSRGRTNSGGSSGSVLSTGIVEWVEKLGGLDALGMWARNRIMDLEGRIDYQSVFMASVQVLGQGGDAPGILLARTMLGNIYSTINRLNTYLPVNLPLPTPGKTSGTVTPTSATAPGAVELKSSATQFPSFPSEWNALSTNHFIWSAVWWLLVSIWRQIIALSTSESLDKERQLNRAKLLQSAVAKLYGLSKLTVEVFGVREEDRAAIEAGVVGGGDGELNSSPTGGSLQWGLRSEEDEQDAYSTELMPGVITPDLYAKDKNRHVTNAGREQIRLGLRKCDPRDVPVYQSPRVEKLVMSYEYEWIVKLTGWIAKVFDVQYAKLREKYPQLPADAGLHWLRFFAAKQNLLFTTAVVVIGSMLFWFLGWLLFSPSGAEVTAASGSGGRTPGVAHGQQDYARLKQQAQYRARQVKQQQYRRSDQAAY